MGYPDRAVIFFEEEGTGLSEDARPLMLESVQGRPVLSWACETLSDHGVQRFFVAAPSRWETEIRTCMPPDADAAVSERHAELMDFLDTGESVLVLSRPAFPLEQAGVGFAYSAPGKALRERWLEKMTNAVSEAELVPGWIPILDRGTLKEIRAFLGEDAEKT